jgi:hypothetical protein
MCVGYMELPGFADLGHRRGESGRSWIFQSNYLQDHLWIAPYIFVPARSKSVKCTNAILYIKRYIVQNVEMLIGTLWPNIAIERISQNRPCNLQN